MAATPVLPGELYTFLIDLEMNNNRAWFQRNKERFETELRGPALEFIEGFAPLLAKISPHFLADARKSGGSLFRIHRDTRFARDKTPYKTHCGIQFRHERGKDVHCPGYYLHLSPTESFVGVGIWHPEKDSLAAIRAHLVADGPGWKKAIKGKAFRERFELAGESLKRAPKGYDVDHPMIVDLRRKDFIAVQALDPDAALRPGFAKELAATFRAGTPLMRWLCTATGVPF